MEYKGQKLQWRLLGVLNKGNVTGRREKLSGMIWENAWIILSLQMTNWWLTKSDDESTLYRIFRNVYCIRYVCGCTAQFSTKMSNGRYFLCFYSLSLLKNLNNVWYIVFIECLIPMHWYFKRLFHHR